jgi:hypothetical protein
VEREEGKVPVGSDVPDSGIEAIPQDVPPTPDTAMGASGDRSSPPVGDTPDGGPKDEWIDRDAHIIRLHRQPRRTMFVPTDCSDPPPIPLKYIDVQRVTLTSLDTADESRIHDVWDGSLADSRPLSDEWTGETRFQKVLLVPEGYDLVEGRLTRRQKTQRPPDVWPEMWSTMSSAARRSAREHWETYAKSIEAAREKRGLQVKTDGLPLPDHMLPAALKHGGAGGVVLGAPGDRSDETIGPRVAETAPAASAGDDTRPSKCHVVDHWGHTVPAMPTDPLVAPCAHRDGEPDTMGLHAMVARSIPIREAMQIPEAKKALDAEWQKLWDMRCWIAESVREVDDVRREAHEKEKDGTLR